jgi:hypothetical protein
MELVHSVISQWHTFSLATVRLLNNELSDQSLQRFVALLAAGGTLLLVFAQGAVPKALQAGEQHINQVVLEPKILVSNKGDDVQIAVRIVPARDLEDFRFDDAMSVVLDPLGVQRESLEHRAQLMIKASHQVQIRHLLLDLGRPG